MIRADLVKKGLLFAGTESSLYVSFDDGDHWQSLALNAPNTSYRDMVVKGNDIVVGTYGRSFWVLDDISPLRQIIPAKTSDPVVLYQPGTAVRVRRNVNGDTPFPPEIPHAVNPPVGALIYYQVNQPLSGLLTIEISDSTGKVVRHLSSAAIPPLNEPEPPIPNFWIEVPSPLPTSQGLNRINWDLRYDAPPAFSHGYDINANPGETPAGPLGPLALPGTYTVTLKVDGKVFKQPFVVVNDPRSPATLGDLRSQSKLQFAAYNGSLEAFDAYQSMTKLRSSITALLDTKLPEDVSKALTDFDTKLSALRGSAGGGRRGFGGAPGGARPAPSAVRVMGSLVTFVVTLDSGDMAPNETMIRTEASLIADLKQVKEGWATLKTKDLASLNALLEKRGLAKVSL